MKLRWTKLAIADLDSAFEYVAIDDLSPAEGIIGRIEQSVSVLIRHPSAGCAGRVPGTREFPVPGTPFIVAYRLRRGALEILGVIHGARKWPEGF